MRLFTVSRPLLIILLVACAAPARADESDQHMVWDIELRDAAPAINEFINGRIASVLELVNANNPSCDCNTLTEGILTDIYQDRLRADLPAYIESAETIDVYPPRTIVNGDIIDHSIYRHAITGLTIRVTRNIRIGDVYLSTDKLNHFFGIGRRYYARYQSFRLEGQSHEEAEKNAILWGILTENTILGTTTNGIFSHADLEANYQGLQFALALCGSEKPYLVHGEGKWSVARTVDLAKYIAPAFDESFNPPLYGSLIKESIYVVFKADFVEKARSETVARRFQKYRAIIPPPSPSMRIVADYLREKGVPSQRADYMQALGLTENDAAAPMDAMAAAEQPAEN